MNRKTLSLADWQQQAGISNSSTPVAGEDLVYSTGHGKIIAEKPEKPDSMAFADGKLRLQRQTKKRGGKAVIVISGIAGNREALQAVCKTLKQACACGGSVKDGSILLQNDQRAQVEAALQKLGYATIWSGG
ncbi:translation initiation factor [Alkalimonas sp. MEB108]|uniref:Translation initiation factor n=1 Tax=Alkalimonas cellulosilytica TaxID=3058395 RepID=A0ABU7J5H6_9GAMM|nr:translation initiation factor [Alkalimonas sp. MEB108]MEE2001761.1 translation initiation factor [Alkalimonas sp. MEB108]